MTGLIVQRLLQSKFSRYDFRRWLLILCIVNELLKVTPTQEAQKQTSTSQNHSRCLYNNNIQTALRQPQAY